VVQANPQAYLQQYGVQLLDASTLVQQARSAGVVEDISAPAGASVGFSANSYGQESSFGASSGVAAGAGAGFSAGGAEFGSGGGGGSGAGFGGSSFESSSVSSGGGAGFEGSFATGGGGFGGSSFESSSFSSGSTGGANSAFQQVDANRDGRVDINEFGNFAGQNLGGGLSQQSYSSSFSY
ncbi:unnamed protein product, partial [Rotaria magnacalcarata]